MIQLQQTNMLQKWSAWFLWLKNEFLDLEVECHWKRQHQNWLFMKQEKFSFYRVSRCEWIVWQWNNLQFSWFCNQALASRKRLTAAHSCNTATFVDNTAITVTRMMAQLFSDEGQVTHDRTQFDLDAHWFSSRKRRTSGLASRWAFTIAKCIGVLPLFSFARRLSGKASESSLRTAGLVP